MNSSLVFQKVTELKKEFKNILVISDYNEIISKIAKLKFQNLFTFHNINLFFRKCFIRK